jgi:chromosome partitioning protein
MGVVVAVVNQKGGVGKTTVLLGLASAAWAAGKQVLVVDADPQANATWALGLEPEGVAFGVSRAVLAGRSGAAKRGISPSTWPTGPGQVDVLPGSGDLIEREIEVGKRRLARRLRKALEGIHERYDLVLIDCSPALGQMTTNALAAADFALIVVEPAALSARGVAAVSDLIDGVWEQHNDELDIAGVIVNRVPAQSGEADRQRELLARMLGRRTIWAPEIPQRNVIAEALGNRLPLHAMGPRAAGSADLFDQHFKKLMALARKRERSRADEG